MTALPHLRRADLLMVGIAYMGFIALGLQSSLLNIAWTPYISDTFTLPVSAVGTLFIVTTVGYISASVAGGRLVGRFGIGAWLIISALLVVLGLGGNAIAPSWPFMVVSGLLIGLGSGAIDTGMNIYFAAHYSPRLMNWLHASFGVGATLGPLLMTTVLRSGQSWRVGYAAAALVFGVLAVAFLAVRARWRAHPPTPVETPQAAVGVRTSGMLPLLGLGMGLFFVYGGLEFSAGQWSAPLFSEGRGIDRALAESWVSLYWGSFTIGRFLYGAAANRLPVVTGLRLCMLGALTGTLLLWWAPVPEIGFAGLALIGFAQAPVFPLLITNTQQRLGGRMAPTAIGLQVGAASLGIALMPSLGGVLAENAGMSVIAPFLVVLAVLTVSLYEITLRAYAFAPQAPAVIAEMGD